MKKYRVTLRVEAIYREPPKKVSEKILRNEEDVRLRYYSDFIANELEKNINSRLDEEWQHNVGVGIFKNSLEKRMLKTP